MENNEQDAISDFHSNEFSHHRFRVVQARVVSLRERHGVAITQDEKIKIYFSLESPGADSTETPGLGDITGFRLLGPMREVDGSVSTSKWNALLESRYKSRLHQKIGLVVSATVEKNPQIMASGHFRALCRAKVGSKQSKIMAWFPPSATPIAGQAVDIRIIGAKSQQSFFALFGEDSVFMSLFDERSNLIHTKSKDNKQDKIHTKQKDTKQGKMTQESRRNKRIGDNRPTRKTALNNFALGGLSNLLKSGV